MLLSIALVIIAIWLNIRCAICFWMILGGLTMYYGTNLIGLALVKPLCKGKIWPIAVAAFLVYLGPIRIAVYMAGVFSLVIKGLKAAFL